MHHTFRRVFLGTPPGLLLPPFLTTNKLFFLLLVEQEREQPAGAPFAQHTHVSFTRTVSRGGLDRATLHLQVPQGGGFRGINSSLKGGRFNPGRGFGCNATII